MLPRSRDGRVAEGMGRKDGPEAARTDEGVLGLCGTEGTWALWVEVVGLPVWGSEDRSGQVQFRAAQKWKARRRNVRDLRRERGFRVDSCSDGPQEWENPVVGRVVERETRKRNATVGMLDGGRVVSRIS